MPAGTLSEDSAPQRPSGGRRFAANALTAAGAGCIFVPAFALASIFVASRCPFVWIIGLPFLLVAVGLVWPISAFVVFLGDHFVNPSGQGAAVDAVDAVVPFVADGGADSEVLGNRRVRLASLGALALAIAIPLTLTLTRPSVDANGLPFTPSQSDLLARPEVQLSPPGSTVYNQQVYPGACSARGDVHTDMGGSQRADAVYRWYDAWLLAHGWKLAQKNPVQANAAFPTIDVTYRRGSREELHLEVGSPPYEPTYGVYKITKPALPKGTISTFEVSYTLNSAH